MRTRKPKDPSEDQARAIARYTWLSTSQAGEIAGGVGDAKVREWIGSGELQALDVGTAKKPEYRIRPDWLDEFVARRTKAVA